MTRVRALCLRVCLGAVLGLPVVAVPVQARTPDGAGKVVMQVALVRHGIRAPTAAPEALAVYSTNPWPAWPVKPGQLTEHGAELMRSVGAWYRDDLARSGIAIGDCAASARVKVISDSTQRNRDSAKALVEGLAPKCAGSYHALPAGQDDPLFRGAERAKGGKKYPPHPPRFSVAAMHTLQYALLGCDDAACLEAARAAGKTLLLGTPDVDALHNAGTLSENLMLEYAQGMPRHDVAWGRLDARGIGEVIALHNDWSTYSRKSLQAATARGSNLLAHVAATLSHAAGQSAGLASLTPAGSTSLVLVGHDTGLAAQAGLLGLDWHSAVQPDDYPPGGMLIYQLLKLGDGYGVRIRVAMPTLLGLRAADVDAPGGMHQATLRIPACGKVEVCPLARFEALVKRVVPEAMVVPQSGDEPVAH